VEFFVIVQRYAISINPSESSMAGVVRSESDLYFLGLKLSECEDVIRRAACAMYSIAVHHPFYEGNKRTALLACELILDGAVITAPEREIHRFVLEVARGNVD